jgi:sec-independent protein translocase protein TatA
LTPELNWAETSPPTARTAIRSNPAPPKREARRRVVELPQSYMMVIAMGLGIPELIIILFIIILIFGANRLPEIGRGIGKGIKNFKEAGKHDDK